MLKAKIRIAGAVNENMLRKFKLLNYTIVDKGSESELVVWLTTNRALYFLVDEIGAYRCQIKEKEFLRNEVEIKELRENELY